MSIATSSFGSMNYLALAPSDNQYIIQSWSPLVQLLTHWKLINTPLKHSQGFLAGGRFMELITFLGCMPYIETDEVEGKEFCFVRFDGPYEQSRLIAGDNTVRPRCPHCQGAIMDWMPIKAAWEDGERSTECPRCGESYSAETVNWKENAGLGRCFIMIGGIHPSEALPSERLLTILKEHSGFDWTWFYVQNPV